MGVGTARTPLIRRITDSKLCSFPIREHGMNWGAKPLQSHERDAMRADPAVIARVIKSYELMLDFYGMQLLDQETGLLSRSPPPRDYAARYTNLKST